MPEHLYVGHMILRMSVHNETFFYFATIVALCGFRGLTVYLTQLNGMRLGGILILTVPGCISLASSIAF